MSILPTKYQVRSDEELRSVVAGLRSPDYPTRLAAIQVLGPFERPEVFEQLRALFFTRNLRVSLLNQEVFRRLPSLTAVQPLADLAQKRVAKSTAAAALAELCCSPEGATLAALLRSPEEQIRNGAAVALGASMYANVVPRSLLRATAPHARLYASPEKQFDVLLIMLDHPNEAARAIAARTLGYSKDTRAAEPLIAAVERSFQPDTLLKNWRAMFGLKLLGDTRATPVLIKTLLYPPDQPKDVLVSWAAQALGALNDERAVEPLMMACRTWIAPSLQGNGFLLRQIVIALGQLGDPRALPILTELLTHSNELIRQEAALAVEKIGSMPAD